jgi:hypothetical protein
VKRRPRIPGTSSRPPRVLYVLPAIPDDAPEELKDGLALRNACATEGRCPSCGAVGEVQPDPTLPGLFHLIFHHKDGCRVLSDPEAA